MKRNVLIRSICTSLAVCVFAGMAMASGSSGDTSGTGSSSGNDNNSSGVSEVSAAEEESKGVELVDSAYYIPDGGDYLCWCVIYKNNDSKTYYEFQKIYVTLYDKDGGVISADDQTMGIIAPGETQAFAGSTDTKGQAVDKVDITVETGSKTTMLDDHISSSEFEFSGTKDTPGDYNDITITGMIKNTSSYECKSASTSVIFKKDGKIVGGYTTYIDDINAGQEKPFEISGYCTVEYDSYEIYAFKWY